MWPANPHMWSLSGLWGVWRPSPLDQDELVELGQTSVFELFSVLSSPMDGEGRGAETHEANESTQPRRLSEMLCFICCLWWLNLQLDGNPPDNRREGGGSDAHPSLLSGHRGLSGHVYNLPGATLMIHLPPFLQTTRSSLPPCSLYHSPAAACSSDSTKERRRSSTHRFTDTFYCIPTQRCFRSGCNCLRRKITSTQAAFPKSKLLFCSLSHTDVMSRSCLRAPQQ